MMNPKKYILAIAAAALMFAGCEKDYNYVAPPSSNTGNNNNNGPEVSFASEIQPIFNASCNNASCHDGTNPPDLRAGKSYSSLVPSFVNTANPTQSELYRRITLSPSDPEFMPEGKSPLPSSEISKILTWIEQGAKNN